MENENRDILVVYGSNPHEEFDWNFYFDERRFSSLPGLPTPSDLEDTLEVEEEADRVLAEFEDSGDEHGLEGLLG
jgi:hypothetical protein